MQKTKNLTIILAIVIIASLFFIVRHRQSLYQTDKINDALIEVDAAYTKNSSHVYFHGKELVFADPLTFTTLGYGWSKDNSHVYYEDLLKGEIDAQSFHEITNCTSEYEGPGDSYFGDKNQVFFMGKLMTNVDPSVHYLGFGYSMDSNEVFFQCSQSLKDVDPATFRIVSRFYAKDKSRMYYSGDLVIGADLGTFSVLEDIDGMGSSYAKDKSKVYFGGEVMNDADVNTFVLVYNGQVPYAKDKNHVYLNNKIEPGIRPENCTADTLEKCIR